MERIRGANWGRVSDRLSSSRVLVLTIILTGIFMTSCSAKGQNREMEESPQYKDGKFQNAKKGIYDSGAAWRKKSM